MANALLTPTAVTRESLRVLHQKLNFVGAVTRDYDDSYAKSGAKIGDTLKIRLPNQYTVRSGATLAAQDTTESSVSLQVATQKGVDLNFTSVDLTLSLDDFSKRIIDPAMSVLAANIEADALNMYKDVYQSVWNGGSAATYNKALDCRVLLQRSLTPNNDRTMLLDPQAMADVIKDTKTLFQDQASIAKQFKEGMVGRAAGFDWGENTLLPSHTRGAADTAYVVNTSTGITSGTASVVVATGTGAASKGDVFTIAGVYSVHPETKASTGQLQQFVLTADYAGGAGNLAVAPTPVTSGAKQNVTIVSAGSGKAVVWAGTASTAVQTGLAFQKGAFAFATADLVMPSGVDFAGREVMDGLSMRIVRAYDINNDQFPCRLDILYGYKTLRAALAARYHNN
ncbi:MAG TPA: P22 phage major capsid protein family protein [Propionibacteriaceae bacterium]